MKCDFCPKEYEGITGIAEFLFHSIIKHSKEFEKPSLTRDTTREIPKIKSYDESNWSSHTEHGRGKQTAHYFKNGNPGEESVCGFVNLTTRFVKKFHGKVNENKKCKHCVNILNILKVEAVV